MWVCVCVCVCVIQLREYVSYKKRGLNLVFIFNSNAFAVTTGRSHESDVIETTFNWQRIKQTFTSDLLFMLNWCCVFILFYFIAFYRIKAFDTMINHTIEKKKKETIKK